MDPNSLDNNNKSEPAFAVPKDPIHVQDALDNTPTSEHKTSTIRTFQSDVAGSVKADNVTMIKIALAEKERREKEGSYFEVDRPKKNHTPVIVLILVVLMTISASVGFVYWYFNKPAAPTLEETIAPREPMILYSETQSQVSVSNKGTDEILFDLRKETLAKLDLGTIKRILVTETVGTTTTNLSAQSFLKSIRSRAPESLLRAINPYFFIGAYSFAPHDVFIIFKVNSYDTAYPAMLEWETSLETDLGKLFIETASKSTTQNEEVIAEADENATTTKDTAETPRTTKTTADSTGNIFKDKIIQNKDVRALVTPQGKILFMYTFLDKNTLVIVSSEKGLKEIITRMTTGRIKR